MTNEQLEHIAGQHAREAVISVDEFIRRVRLNDAYKWRNTEWGKALLALEQTRHNAPPIPPIPPASGYVMGQRCVYVSGDISDELCNWFASLGPKHTILFSADRLQSVPGMPYHVSDAQIALCRRGGGKVASWCDGDQTPIGYAVSMQRDRQLDFASAQFETDGQYDALIAAGLPLGIGNPANISVSRRQDAASRIVNGRLALIGEVLHPDPFYSGQGVPIAGCCFYVDMDDAHGGYQPLASFSSMPDGMKASCSLYTGGRATAVDRTLYSVWTR